MAKSEIKIQQTPTLLSKHSPIGALLLGIIAIQVGAGIAVHLFPILGVEGTAAVRIVFSAIILSLAARNQLSNFRQIFLDNWMLLTLFGLSITTMNFFFYKAIELIPLGAAVAIDFIGPLGVAAITSRRASHFACIIIAAIGIILLTPLGGADLNTLGVCFALVTATGWASFILLARLIGKRVSGNIGLTIAMIISAITMIPFFVPVVSTLILNPWALIIGLGVALLSTSIPFSLEFYALKHIPVRFYGVLTSLEPAVGAMVGVVLLEEHIGTQGILAITCVIVAAIGMALSEQ